jgi:hypothetical protein
MSIGIICCRVLEREVRALARSTPQVSHLEVMEWGLHIEPNRLVEAVADRICAMQDRVEAVMLGYGRCQALDRLPATFRVPVLRPEGEDCIGVLMGQDRYNDALLKEAGTWFFTPGWAEMGMDFVFRELGLTRYAEKGFDPFTMARRMLRDFTRGLFVEVEGIDQASLITRAREISDAFDLRFEKTHGSLDRLRQALRQTLCAAEGAPGEEGALRSGCACHQSIAGKCQPG